MNIVKKDVEHIQDKITHYTEEYMRLFPAEYTDFKLGMRAKRENTNKFGEMKGGSGMVERVILEYPETLYTIFEKTLTPEQFQYICSKEGSRWFGRKFKEFAITEI